jgi:uncharacterized membrane protein YccC
MANPTSKYRAELRLVIRALTAAALSLVTADALALPQGYWAVFTALIIVQGSVGGTLAAGLDRFIGTLAGAVLGGAVAVTGEFWRVPRVLLLMLAVAPVSPARGDTPKFPNCSCDGRHSAAYNPKQRLSNHLCDGPRR